MSTHNIGFSRRGDSNEYLQHRFLAHLSRRHVGELIVYPWSGVRPSSVSEKKIFENGGRRTEHGYTIGSSCEPDG